MSLDYPIFGDGDLLAEVEELRAASAVTSRVVHRLHSERERYYLAWTSARQRAEAFWDELEDALDERDALRAEVVALGKELEAVRISADAAVSKAHREAGTW